LEAASSEEEYRDLKTRFDYNQLQVDKLREKTDREQTMLERLEGELETIQHRLDVLNMVNDSRALDRDFGNWKNRRQRVVERNQKLMRELTELETLQANLNEQWRELTRDKDDLCGPLLRTERKIFII